MKYPLSFIGIALLAATLVLGCGKHEEPTGAQKAAPEQKPAGEQTAPAVKAVPAQKEAEHKELPKPGPTQAEENQGQNPDLNQALLAYLAKTGVDPKYANPHQTARIDLNGDGRQDAIVLLESPIYFCGTGGCTMLVFKGTPSGFEFVSRSTLIRGPVLVSDTNTHGWRDLIVEVSGGGIAPKQVALKYTGSEYPPNPSTLPPLPKDQPLKGAKVFEGKLVSARQEAVKHETLAQEPGKEGTAKLQIYDEPGMAIRTEYPDTMAVVGTGSGEGSGFIFSFKPRGNALDKAKVHIFLPRGAATAAAQEPFVTGPNGLLENNGWKKEDASTDTGNFPHGWVKKIISFTDPKNKDMAGKVLLGEASGQAVQVILYYPADMADAFFANTDIILGKLHFKSDKLPLGKSH
jgi:hypothetical protein